MDIVPQGELQCAQKQGRKLQVSSKEVRLRLPLAAPVLPKTSPAMPVKAFVER